MDISTVLNFANELRERLDKLKSQSRQMDADLARTKKELEDRCAALDESVKSSVDSYVANQQKILLEKMEAVSIGFDAEVRRLRKNNTKTYAEESEEANCDRLNQIFCRMEELCKELNEISFDEEDHPIDYIVDEKNFQIIAKDTITGDTKCVNSVGYYAPQSNSDFYFPKINELARLIVEAEARIKTMGKQHIERLDVPSMSRRASLLAKRLLEEYKEEQESEHRQEARRLFAEEDRLINAAFFRELETAMSKYEPDYVNGSDQFSSSLAIGTMDIPYSDNMARDGKYIRLSPLLSRYAADGVVRAPMILNLKKQGNILIDDTGTDGRLSERTIAFIHQYIQEFLLAQPACRVNLCLTDFNDQCKFNRYAPLKSMNVNALFKGIIRNEREIDGIVADMEKLMFDISDNKLSFNGVDNIFEFNQRSVENPQSMHLMVLLDFPEKYSADTISHIEKIISNGNNSGIFTLIVRNSKFCTDYGSRQSLYESAMASIEKNCVHITETENGYELGKRRYLTPLKTLPVSDFARNVLPVLENSANKQKETVIPMAPMFELSDQYHRSNDDPVKSSKLIEIPIGKNGGEVQSIKFSTTGDSAAHALVIGGTGSGKSNLLHTIILSACYRYSPKELQIYLIDFKGGVEFKYYEARKIVENQLPHIALTGLTSEPEDGVAILTNIKAILRERENLFRRNDVEDIVQYNSKFSKEEMLPRLLIIIDEVQELFTHEKLGQQALNILGELFKKGRAFGISILWASQTVPKAVGGDFKDKVLSQIGNRICLKLNNADDAEAIGFNAAKVRALNRPEKGLGIIFDGMDYVEFRVAYAEKKENRLNYIHKINCRWDEDIRNWKDRKPLFIVGDDEVPKASEGAQKFLIGSLRTKLPKSGDEYDLSLGQDYISGEPFRLPVAIRGTKENCWIAGKDVGALRDAIGYAMLSVALENYTNSDISEFDHNIYYFNGELINKDKEDLFYVLPEKFKDMTVCLEGNEAFVDAMIELYKLRRERYAHIASTHSPVFIFVHKLQILAELFSESKLYNLSDEVSEAPAAVSFGGFVSMSGAQTGTGITGGSRMTFREIMKELVSRGPDVGIHFVFTMNDPCSIPELKNELRDFAYKLVLTGVSNDAVGQMTDNYLLREKSPNKDGVAFCYHGTSMSKLKLYRYESEQDETWLNSLLNTYM